MAKATVKNVDDSIDFLATQDYASGDIISIAGQLGVVQGLSGVKSGSTGNARITGAVDLPKASGTVFADGDAVQFNHGTGLAVIAGGTTPGRAIGDTPAGAITVRTLINKS